MIVLTGGAGFIGANALEALNRAGESDVLVVDEVGTSEKWRHLIGQQFRDYTHKDHLWRWLEENRRVPITGVIHLGACTDTMETDFDYVIENNVGYSRRLWALCVEHQVPFVYASSAATYGDGSLGFSDNEKLLPTLRPLNPYGFSKHLFDLWVLSQEQTPPQWAGLKFFNVYGPHEEHKGRMASAAYHFYRQASQQSRIGLFKSHRPEFGNGEQVRDFVYVRDVVGVIMHVLGSRGLSGIYNVGTGRGRTFNDMASALFTALGRPPAVDHIDMPPGLREHYQYFTQADVAKLRRSGYTMPFTTLEDGVAAYVRFLEDTTLGQVPHISQRE